jgi:hypothetical protein
MPTGIRPRVNGDAREFLRIAKDFKEAREIIREALSNSWESSATRASIKFNLFPVPGSRKKKLVVDITDDGNRFTFHRKLDHWLGISPVPRWTPQEEAMTRKRRLKANGRGASARHQALKAINAKTGTAQP